MALLAYFLPEALSLVVLATDGPAYAFGVLLFTSALRHFSLYVLATLDNRG